MVLLSNLLIKVTSEFLDNATKIIEKKVWLTLETLYLRLHI